jgi:hypothetical protein
MKERDSHFDSLLTLHATFLFSLSCHICCPRTERHLESTYRDKAPFFWLLLPPSTLYLFLSLTPRPFNVNTTKTHALMGLAVDFWLKKDQFGRRDLVMGRCHMEPSSMDTRALTEYGPCYPSPSGQGPCLACQLQLQFPASS